MKTCPVCKKKTTVWKVKEAWNKNLDDLLCEKHLKELLKLFK